MNIDHTQRVAIVTGGSRGIGRAVAERLAAEGMAVVVAYVSNDREAMETVNTIHAKGGAALAFRADVADEQAVAALFDISEQTFGGVDVVVNAAGIMLLSPLAELDLAQLDRMLRTNVRGTFVVAQQAVRRVRKGGAIITFSTSVTKVALPTYGAYAATKGAVDALSLIAARELRGRDITFNAVAPGPTATELYLNGKDDETIEQAAKANPMERLGQPEDVAELVSFLAGQGRWVNGQTVYLNGGMI